MALKVDRIATYITCMSVSQIHIQTQRTSLHDKLVKRDYGSLFTIKLDKQIPTQLAPIGLGLGLCCPNNPIH